jgi:hypothetical protein
VKVTLSRAPSTINVNDGPNLTGSLLASAPLPETNPCFNGTHNDCGGAGKTVKWSNVTLVFSGVARSVAFPSTFVFFDDFLIELVIGPTPAPAIRPTAVPSSDPTPLFVVPATKRPTRQPTNLATKRVVLDFEGTLDTYDIPDYNGGGEKRGPFGTNVIGAIAADAGGQSNLPFANLSSPNTTSFQAWDASQSFVTVRAGFTRLSFQYTSIEVTVFDGPDMTGNILESVPIPAICVGSGGSCDDPPGTFLVWKSFTVPFVGVAKSAGFSTSESSNFLFDDMAIDLVLPPPTANPTVFSEPVTGIPTKAPAMRPTKAPVKLPTQAPTKQPVKPPTNAPAKPRTKAPTKRPVKPPTKAPRKGKAPTKRPVRKRPTKRPTKMPRRRPRRQRVAQDRMRKQGRELR